ncbi:amino acid ABC transporter permease [Roseibacterium sp. SDUM158017]|uniref:amino acid ABC transporter permease n=1 Tax=Roseicyclus salinarum TaxID=3036773 RepID=UPI00241593EE|nr:amino acid ABC transporter permease [Roseibacterium sp. SDUM158017]MDG4650230.1 amino acid ABC transporter permease [Roseibacterium sp. SDUM158017]
MSDTHAQTVAYVRDTMLPQQTPPPTAAGAIKWLRENLFSSWLNALLTVVSIYVIYWVVSHIAGWMFYGIWDASSLSECREIRNQLYGEGSNVACWAVLTDRWDQLMFGFYPPELYWRPVLALFVFLLAISPVLYDGLPRKLIYFTAVSPFVLFFLLWGGTIWGPIAVALGFVLGWAAFRFGSPVLGSLGATIAAFVVPILYWLLAAGPIAGALGSVIPIGIEFVPSDDFGGFMLAFVIGIAGIILSLPLGIVLALGRQSDLFIINKFSVIFIEVIRGVPLIVWLFTASLLLNYFLPPGTNFDLMLRVIIMVTLFASAYIAEVVRGGLAALPRGQYEGADSLGLDYWQSMRLIILPQALKISIPGIVSTFIGLFKDTTLVVFIGLLDPVGLSNAIRATTDWNGIYWELFIFIGLCFFVCCYAMSQYSQWLERKLRTDHR